MPVWWGNPAKDICRLDSMPLMSPKGGAVDPWAPNPKDSGAPRAFSSSHAKKSSRTPMVTIRIM
ncbi:hypothetical protein BGZ96_003490 [Linnemannia gamsii]|uniref:Uncharacterized protein n=1 Tax=Linnemannia gamsii TaxID=64522 RepID=A0ABQ7JJ76_9FUNG|nr:hypothetical protein BGZ96_003490 [Linnemannia gamsii]